MKVVVLTAPSGAGKTTIARKLLTAFPRMRFSVSATTRTPRTGEVDGVDYHFISEDRFRSLVDQDEFVEHEEVYPGRLYGTLKSELRKGSADSPVLLDIDVKGALNVKQMCAHDACTIYIKPPSIQELLDRLKLRGTDSSLDVQTRRSRFEYETSFEDRFDHVVINDDLDTAILETIEIVTAFLLATGEK